MSPNTWLAIGAGLAFLAVVAGLPALLWYVRLATKATDAHDGRDPVVGIDQWAAERRQHLADLQRPAAKFIEARRKER